MFAKYRKFIQGDTAVIPDTVTELECQAFSECRTLRTVHLPDSLERIGDYCFSDCPDLTSIHIPAGVTSIGKCAFSKCPALESITVSRGNPCYRSIDNCLLSEDLEHLLVGCKNSIIPDSVVYLDAYAFSGRSGLGDITIPENVGSIGDFCFSDCPDLTSIHIPAGVVFIGEGAFSRCPALESITVSPDNYDYRSINGCLLTKDRKTLIGCCRHPVIPEGVETIGNWSCSGISGLRGINLPDGVLEIGAHAFEDCPDLESIIIPDSVYRFGRDAFSGCASLTSIWIPRGMHIDLFRGCSNLRNIVCSEYVSCLHASFFSDLPALERVSVSPDNPWYRNIGDRLLSKDGKELIWSCGNPVIPMGVEIIGERSFSMRPELEEICIRDGVRKIEDYAFEKCTGLKRITIPASVTEIGEHAFWGCSALESISVSPDNPYYRSISNCLLSKDGTQLMAGSNTSTIPDTVTHIWKGAFYGRSGLRSISIPQDVTDIGAFAFAECSALSSISVSSANQYYSASGNCLLSKDGKTLLFGCRTSVIPDGVETIQRDAFRNQTGLFHIVIPSSVKKIGIYAFADCTNLLEVWISDRVERVDPGAFVRCRSLQRIIIEPGPPPHEVDKEKVEGLFMRAFLSSCPPPFILAASRPSEKRSYGTGVPGFALHNRPGES